MKTTVQPLNKMNAAVYCLLLGSAYFLWVTVTGLSLPCPLHYFTGYYCPGCGEMHTRDAAELGHVGGDGLHQPRLARRRRGGRRLRQRGDGEDGEEEK